MITLAIGFELSRGDLVEVAAKDDGTFAMAGVVFTRAECERYAETIYEVLERSDVADDFDVGYEAGYAQRAAEQGQFNLRYATDDGGEWVIEIHSGDGFCKETTPYKSKAAVFSAEQVDAIMRNRELQDFPILEKVPA